METWLLVVILPISLLLLRPILSHLFKTKKLPPGPTTIPIISGLLWLLKPFWVFESTIRNLHARYGPIITLPIGFRPTIFISNRSLAHQALIQNGAAFADRPTGRATRIFTINQYNISSAVYGPTWRLLRRNLTSEILHPSRLRSYGRARKLVLDILANRLMESNGVKVEEHFHHAIFSLVVVMCFGGKLDEEQIDQIKQRLVLSMGSRFNILNFLPWLTKVVMKKRSAELFQLQKQQEDVFLPLIRARKTEAKLKEDYVLSYVDTLLDLELPDEKRKLTEDEIISLCEEFLNAGTATTSTAMQWIMANIVKYPTVQERLVAEIRGVLLAEETDEVKEEDLQKMPYLKAVVLEGLRRHPPSHFLLPHSVMHDVVLEGHVVPKNGTVNFMVADIGLDPEVWENPMEFKPERFLNSEGGEADEGFDITGSREIKMMPFGVGRRMCPGLGLASLHLEYFVANLVWKFEWSGVKGEDVDLAEKQGFIIMAMKNPFKAQISPRVKKMK